MGTYKSTVKDFLPTNIYMYITTKGLTFCRPHIHVYIVHVQITHNKTVPTCVHVVSVPDPTSHKEEGLATFMHFLVVCNTLELLSNVGAVV